jgi:hypothetical protein
MIDRILPFTGDCFVALKAPLAMTELFLIITPYEEQQINLFSMLLLLNNRGCDFIAHVAYP